MPPAGGRPGHHGAAPMAQVVPLSQPEARSLGGRPALVQASPPPPQDPGIISLYLPLLPATHLSSAHPVSSHPAQAPNIASSRRLCCKNVSHHIAAAHSQSSDCETEPGDGGRGWKTGTALLSYFSTEELSTACALDGCAQAAEMRVLRTALNPYPGKQAAQHRGT